MKTKILLALFATIVTGFAATVLTWDPSPTEDAVIRYVLEYRTVDAEEWTRVEVEAPNNRVSIPELAYGRWFRIAAENSFGVGEWSVPVKLPEKVKGLSLVIEITP